MSVIKLLFITVALSFVIIVRSSTKSGEGWSYKHVMERNCLKCACLGLPIKEKQRPAILKILSQKLYQLMCSKLSCTYSIVVMKGVPVLSNSDVDNFCYFTTFDLNAGWRTHTMDDGRNISSRVSIKSLSKISLYNYQQHFDPMEMPQNLGNIYIKMTAPKRLSIIWTNGKAILFTVCRWDHGQTAWFVYATEKVLSRRAKKTIMKKVVELGFDPKKAYTVDYRNCNN